MSRGREQAGSGFRTTRTFEVRRGGVAFTVGATELTVERMALTPRQMLERVMEEMSGTILSTRESILDDVWEVRFDAIVQGREMRGRILVVGRRSYSATVDAPPGMIDERTVTAFLDSLKLSPVILAEAR
jgi:hypothetical protein